MESGLYGAGGAGRSNGPNRPPLLPNTHLPAKPHAVGEHCSGDSCLACKTFIRHYIESINWMVFSDGRGSPPPFSATSANICDMIQSLWRLTSQKQQLTRANTIAMANEIAYLRQQLELQRQELQAAPNLSRASAEGSVQAESAVAPSSLNGAFPFLPTAFTVSPITAREQLNLYGSTVGTVPSSVQFNYQSVLTLPSTPRLPRSIGEAVDTVTQLFSALPIATPTPKPNASNMLNTTNTPFAYHPSTPGPFGSAYYPNPSAASSSENASQHLPSIEELNRASARMYISTLDGRLYADTFPSSERLSSFSPTAVASESESRKRLRSDSEGENGSLVAPPGSSKRPRTADRQLQVETGGTETDSSKMDRENSEELTAFATEAGRPGPNMLPPDSLPQPQTQTTRGLIPYCAEGLASGSASTRDGGSQAKLVSSPRPTPPLVLSNEVDGASERPQLTIDTPPCNTHHAPEADILQTVVSRSSMPAEMRSSTREDSASPTAPRHNSRPLASETLSSHQAAPTTGAETSMGRVAIENSTRPVPSEQRRSEEGTRRLLPPRPPIPSPFRNALPRIIRAEASVTTDIVRDQAQRVMPSIASRLSPSTQNPPAMSATVLARAPTETSGQQRDAPRATRPERTVDLAAALRRLADLDSAGRDGHDDVARPSEDAAGRATAAAAIVGNDGLGTGRHRPRPPVSYQTRNVRRTPAPARRDPVHDPGFVIYQDPEPPARPQSSQQRSHSVRRTRGRPTPTGIENTPPILEESSDYAPGDSSPEHERLPRWSTRRL